MPDRDSVFIPYGRHPGEGARVDLRMVAFFGVMVLLLALAGWLYLRQASEVAELASEIRVLELEKEERQRELITLRGQVAMLGSLKRLLNEGIDRGYRLPDATTTDGQLIVACSDDCPDTGPAGLAVAPGSDDSGQSGALSAWSGFLDRLERWLKPVLPAR
jgi:hypothetical protein